MKNLIKILIFCIIFCNLHCTKYPEDKFYTPKSSKKRLENKRSQDYIWKITSIIVNGEDVTYKYNDSIQPFTLNEVHFTFDFDFDPSTGGRKYDIVRLNRNPDNSLADTDIAIWGTWIDTKEKLFGFTRRDVLFEVKDSLIHRKLSNLLFFSWKINKLWKDDFHLTTIKNSNEYHVFFQK